MTVKFVCDILRMGQICRLRSHFPQMTLKHPSVTVKKMSELHLCTLRPATVQRDWPSGLADFRVEDRSSAGLGAPRGVLC